MGLFRENERVPAEALVRLGYFNPFVPERIELERQVLGERFVEMGYAWHKHPDEVMQRPNIDRMARFAEELAERLRARLLDRSPYDDGELALYEDVALYFIYNKHKQNFFEYIQRMACADSAAGSKGSADTAPEFYSSFRQDMEHYFALPGLSFPSLDEAGHLFACFFQLRNAFHNIFENIIGGSAASARLRAAVWQSVFTCDVRRYRRGLYKRMADITTLVTGPSGTGKELVARAIGLSPYIPFDPQRSRFVVDFSTCFQPLNLSALPPTLIESELFGHAKGAFTGAVKDRSGFLEVCVPFGTVFLDEIGELDASIQVKLLRVLQTRTFQRIGETTDRHFRGKVVAATNRDLGKEMQEGRFREDFYYRLCSDIIVTPSLREQLDGAQEQLQNLLVFIAKRVAGQDEAKALADEVERWITDNMPPDYPWPGNVRELEQCVRNVMVRHAYNPTKPHKQPAEDTFLEAVRTGHLTVAELLRHYCTRVYAETGSYQEAARRLELDRRTVKGHVDPELLALYRQHRPSHSS